MNFRNIYIFICFIILLPAGFVNSQNKADSLINVFKKSKLDTNLVNSLVAISLKLSAVNPKSGLYVGQKALLLATHLKYERGIAKSYFIISAPYSYMGKNEEELYYLNQALNIYQHLGDQPAIAKCYNNIGLNYFSQNKYTNSLKYLQLSLNINEKLKNVKGTCINLLNTGNIYYIQKNYQYALKYYKTALLFSKEINDKSMQASTLINIALILDAQGFHEEASTYFKKSKEFFEESGDSKDIAKCYSYISGNYIKLNKYEKALEYGLKAKDIFKTAEHKEDLANILITLTEVYLKTKEYKKALGLSKQALKTAREIKAMIPEQNAYFYLSAINDSLKNYEAALEFHKLYSSIADSVVNYESNKKLLELQTKYDVDKKDKQLNIQKLSLEKQQLILNRKNNMISGIILISLLFVFIIFLLFSQYRLRENKSKIELQQKLLRTQMNPHFMFNSLLSIQSYMYENNAEDASYYLAKFAELMRLILDNSREEYISLAKEIKTLENYMELQKIRYENKFDYIINVNIPLQKDLIYVPPMLAQPFIENAIEHGLVEKKSEGMVEISFSHINNLIIYEITDNGIGFQHSINKKTEIMNKRKSLALEITKERLYCLNKKSLRKKIKFKIIDMSTLKGENKTGTKVTFTIPFSYKY